MKILYNNNDLNRISSEIREIEGRMAPIITDYSTQIRQNEIARKNALQRYASEQLKIRQVAQQSSQKGLEATLKARKARAEFITTAGSSGIALSGSTNALLADFYRTESNYKASLARNLDINVSQFERNLEAIQFGQEAQSTYVQPPNPTLLFASAVGNVANTYYGIEMQKQNMGLIFRLELLSRAKFSF